jgi:hypothetical protein
VDFAVARVQSVRAQGDHHRPFAGPAPRSSFSSHEGGGARRAARRERGGGGALRARRAVLRAGRGRDAPAVARGGLWRCFRPSRGPRGEAPASVAGAARGAGRGGGAAGVRRADVASRARGDSGWGGAGSRRGAGALRRSRVRAGGPGSAPRRAGGARWDSGPLPEHPPIAGTHRVVGRRGGERPRRLARDPARGARAGGRDGLRRPGGGPRRSRRRER